MLGLGLTAPFLPRTRRPAPRRAPSQIPPRAARAAPPAPFRLRRPPRPAARPSVRLLSVLLARAVDLLAARGAVGARERLVLLLLLPAHRWVGLQLPAGVEGLDGLASALRLATAKLLRLPHARSSQRPAGLEHGQQVLGVLTHSVPFGVVLDGVVESEPDIPCEQLGVRVGLPRVQHLLDGAQIHRCFDDLHVVRTLVLLWVHWLQERIRPSVLAELRKQQNTFRAPNPFLHGCVFRAGLPRWLPPRALARPGWHLCSSGARLNRWS
mmetsp:Transcript_17181/g.38368  ORF Transcript_17181/g.38368 Transcript_17181/m.38368 type:complete len:268 (-) Transcript_17181:28-831(-)